MMCSSLHHSITDRFGEVEPFFSKDIDLLRDKDDRYEGLSALLDPSKYPSTYDEIQLERGAESSKETLFIRPQHGVRSVRTLHSGEAVGNGFTVRWAYRCGGRSKAHQFYTFKRPDKPHVLCPIHIELSAKELSLWEQATNNPDWSLWSYDTMFYERSPNLAYEKPGFMNIFGTERDKSLLYIVMSFLLMAYGGVHTIAWDFPFPTRKECILWRISCLNLTAPGLFLAFYSVIVSPINAWLSRRSVNTESKWAYLAMGLWVHKTLELFVVAGLVLFLFSVPSYAFSRLFVVLESFLSVRHLPIGVYAAVPWVNAIPHF